MARHGAYARRNAGHRARRKALLDQAGSDWDRLRVAFDGFRSAVRLLQKRRPPLGTPPGTHDATAAALVADAARYLQGLAERIDIGEYDATKKETA
jgi:hypothetical protein